MAHCNRCGKEVKKEFNFCPHCGHNIQQEKERKNYGLLGRDNEAPQNNNDIPMMPMGLNKIMNSLMNQLNKELGGMGKGIQINFSSNIPGLENPSQKRPTIKKIPISQEKMERIAKLPRKEAKTEMKRMGNKIIYDIKLPGVKSTSDIIINKTESGIEIKAISDKVLHTKTIPLNKLLRYRLMNEILNMEFQGS